MRLFHNDDCDVFFHNCSLQKVDPTEENQRNYIRSFDNSGITDLVFNIGGQCNSVTPSKIWKFMGDSSISWNLSKTPIGWLDAVQKCYQEFHLDFLTIFIEEARKCHIHPWISIRMNDVHNNRRAGTRSLYHDHLDARYADGQTRTHYREVSGYFDDAFDYANKKVFQDHLDYIIEQINQYDADGVELDFSREGFCFAPGLEEEGREIIHNFVKTLRDELDKLESKRGHKIEILVRTFATPVSDYRSGIDAVGLAQDNLCDIVVPCSRFGTSDDSIPVMVWKRLLPKRTLLSINQQKELRSYNYPDNHFVDCTPEVRTGLAHAFISEGAESIYLYNESYGIGLFEHEKRVEYYQNIVNDSLRAKAKKSYLVGYNDYMAPGEHDSNLRLPVILNSNVLNYGRYTDIRVFVGKNEGELYLLLGVNATPDDLTLYVNATKPEYIGTTLVNKGFYGEPVLVYKVKPLDGNIRCVELKSNVDHTPSTVLSYVSMQNYMPNLL